MKKISLVCGKCGDKSGPFMIDNYNEKPDFGKCANCGVRNFKIDSEFTL